MAPSQFGFFLLLARPSCCVVPARGDTFRGPVRARDRPQTRANVWACSLAVPRFKIRISENPNPAKPEPKKFADVSVRPQPSNDAASGGSPEKSSTSCSRVSG